MAMKKRKAKTTRIANVLVRGTARNPVPMLGSRKKGTLNKLARLLRSHFPGKRLRVVRVKI